MWTKPKISWCLSGSPWWIRRMLSWGGRCSSIYCKNRISFESWTCRETKTNLWTFQFQRTRERSWEEVRHAESGTAGGPLDRRLAQNGGTAREGSPAAGRTGGHSRQAQRAGAKSAQSGAGVSCIFHFWANTANVIDSLKPFYSIEDDDEIERKLETVDINHKDEKCVIQ